MASELEKMADIIEEEWQHVYACLMNKNKPYAGIGEEHMDVENDEQCKGAMKALEFVKKKIGDMNGG